MTDLLEDIIAYFVANGLVTSDSTFRDFLPDTPDSVIALYEYAGDSKIPQIDALTRSVQIVARSTSPTEAKLKARELYNVLRTETGILHLTSERWCTIVLRNPPFKLRVDASERVIYGFNVGFTTYLD